MVNAPMLIVPGHELVTSKYISPSFAVAFVAGIMLVTSTDMGHTWAWYVGQYGVWCAEVVNNGVACEVVGIYV